mmetsp:Transcript_12353/g.36281  ORF Transcript_12353/g.36281 Transcript_12353/m.36281 type:complete len:290 (+) Transcript_12353:163-1032(+)
MPPPPQQEPEQMKLTYFNDNKGRNELVRLIFAVGKVPYNDHLIGRGEYVTLRDSGGLPWGQVPVLSVPSTEHGVCYEVFGQSCSIARFAAKKAGIYPKSEIEALRTDSVVDSWRDTLDLFYETVFTRKVVGGKMQMFPHAPSQRHRKLADLLATELSAQFARYDIMLRSNGRICQEECEDSRPVWAELAIFDLVKTMESALTKAQFCELMEGKTALVALVRKINDLEEIQAHLDEYPYNDMSSYFVEAKAPILALPLEMIMMPILTLFMGIYTRAMALKPAFTKSKKLN